MPKDKTTVKKAFFCRLTVDLAARLNAYCEQTGVAKTTVVERAITAYLDACTIFSPVARPLDITDKEQ